jgi:GWxTD domain-containing protein
MRRWILTAGLAAINALVPGTGAAQSEEGVNVRAFRFYRADSKQTLVTAFVEVPYRLLDAAATGPGAELKYSVAVEVTDTNGAKLYEASWPGRAKAELATIGAKKLEILDVTVPPGMYRMRVTVVDSVAGRQFTDQATIEAWATQPAASDLMLSPAMRLAGGGDTVPGTGELRRGNTMVTPATHLLLTPLRPKAYYLLEVYGAEADSGTMQVQVMDSTGKALVTTRPAEVLVAPGGSVLKGQLDLSGLPAGRYTMVVATDVGGQRQERSDQFVMADFETTMEREQARLAARRESDEGYFASMNERELDEAEAPLIYLTTSDSLSVWKTDPSVAAKQRFLTRFWKQRDPTPGTPKNEFREQFYRLIATANRDYADGARATAPGWKSDRGRVFVKYGVPSDILDRRTSLGKAPPYLVWRYARGKDRYFIFADRTGFGVYKLIATNDLQESGVAGYKDLLGPDALQDVSRWLGIDLFQDDGSTNALQGP